VSGRPVVDRARRHPLTLFGLFLIGGVALLALLADVVTPYPEHAGLKINMAEKLHPPSPGHPFGTDELGRDVLTRVIYGARVSVTAGIGIVVLTALLGVPLGAIAGYRDDWLSGAIMRTADVFMSVPYLALALGLAAALGADIVHASIAVAIPWWPWYARVVRSQVLTLRSSAFVEAARAVGRSDAAIVFRHILPNCAGVIVVQATLQLGLAILAVGALGFLGMGARPPMPEWGLMIATGRNFLPTWWWPALFPGVLLFATVLGFNLVGDGLRDLIAGD
jgi:peptide/nickel transport system permease protein